MPAESSAKPMATSGRNTTADRAIDVLLLFDDESPVLSAGEVATRLGMSRSTAYRYLQSLRSSDLLEDDQARGGYRLGARLLQLARVARKGMGLSSAALPVMRELAVDVGEAVLLTRRSGRHVICIELEESNQPIRLSYERGHVLPLHAGASAKILLAYAEPSDVEEFLGSGPLEGFTTRTVTDPELLRGQLGAIREAGYVVSDGELDDGVRGIAAPILHADGRPAAGLAIAGPAFRMTNDRLPGLVAAVRSAAARISERLGLITA